MPRAGIEIADLSKKLRRMRHNPASVRWEELLGVLKECGFEVKRPRRGSHYKVKRGEIRLTLPRPKGGGRVKAVYVREVLAIIEQLEIG